MATEKDSSPDKLRLKTEVGLLGGVSLIAGVMVGSGIFMSPQFVLIYIGSPGASLLIWAASGLLAMLASLCYAELGTVIRESGGEYIYILRTSGNIMAFICAFTNNIVLRPTSMIAVALIFAQNALTPFYDDCPPPNGASHLQNFFEGTKLSIRPMGIAFYQCLWSYDGWNTLNYVTEEINHPEKIFVNPAPALPRDPTQQSAARDKT
ncbi:b(0,+)-type amino acid transporter 1-like [Sinocyclocheilus grahami]|uniref:b(0,+)-type amino acid transporter 1-like n=1 Tax=Sinocyclocheilus grahami TaxID=75366 RepID=UPI0007AD224D|nr:PREDICTED: b(0,+)-type amino acid transporter 1-like [Sinocyclocheilus grahami]